MKSLHTFALAAVLFIFPVAVGAQYTGPRADGGEFGTLLGAIIDFVDTRLIPFILGIGFLVFVWGMFRYFIAGAADEEKRANGKNLMIYATLGFVLIIIFWGVINLITGSLGGWGEEELDYNVSIPRPAKTAD